MKFNLPLLTFTLLLAPLGLQAKWSVYGTPDADGDGHGDLQTGSSYQFTTVPKDKESSLESNFWGYTTLNGTPNEEAAWWVASSSESPWDTFIADPNLETQPSMVIYGEVCEGDTIMVGLNFEYELADFTSEFRMANNPFGAGSDFYFGLNNASSDEVLARDGSGESYYVGSNITAADNLTYMGNSLGNEDPAHTPDWQYSGSYDWVHFESQAGEDIVFTIKDPTKDDSMPLALTQWVLFIVVGDVDGSGVIDGSSCINNNVNDASDDAATGLWGPVPLAGQPDSRTDDIVFSWTVHGKGGYTGGDENPLDNPVYDPSDPTIIPEPSNLLLLASSIGLFLGRRNRRQA